MLCTTCSLILAGKLTIFWFSGTYQVGSDSSGLYTEYSKSYPSFVAWYKNIQSISCKIKTALS